MYKKAGIIIAIILVVAGIIVVSIASCSDNGGIQVKPSTTEVSETTSEVQESVKPKTENKTKTESTTENKVKNESTNETTVKTESTNETTVKTESKSEKTDEQKSVTETSKSSIENSKSETSKNNSETSMKNDAKEETSKFEYKETDNNSLPDTKSDSIGVKCTVISKKIVQSDNSIYTMILFADKDGNTYDYFVSYSSYESLSIGDKIVADIRFYISGDKTLKQVIAVKKDSR